MKKLIEYTSFLNERIGRENEHVILKNLRAGFAICVYKDNFNEFFDIIQDAAWIRFNRIDDDEILNSINEKLYFVLFGDVLLHTTEPKFGGHDLEVFTPSFK